MVRHFVTSPPKPEPIRIRLPEDDEMTTLVRSIPKWFKKEGDEVKAGEALCEVDTGEVVFDLQSPVGGYVVRITAHEGSKDLKSGEVVAYLAGALDQITSVKYEASKEIAQNKVTVHLSKQEEEEAAAAVERLAAEVKSPSANMGLEEWLNSVGEGLANEYANVLKSEGFTTIDSIKTLEEADLDAMNISKRAHRKMLLAAAQVLNT
ncbi:hypothetical protein BASA81_003711 [Batrachochytrium salamandrivorans]|nr:hypothetical protein BASA81_003711 [Batrachochytrium salamandrivorans]